MQSAIPIAISRVNQVDAGRLDIEMSAMLKEQMVKVFSVMKVHRYITQLYIRLLKCSNFKFKQLMLSFRG